MVLLREELRLRVVVVVVVERGGQPLEGKKFDSHPPPPVVSFARKGKGPRVRRLSRGPRVRRYATAPMSVKIAKV